MDLIEAQNAFMKWLEVRGFSLPTRVLRRSHMQELVAFLKSRFISNVEDVTQGLLAEYHQWIMGREHSHTGRKLAYSTVIGHLTTVKTFFGFLLQQKVLAFNPALALVWPRKTAPLPMQILTEREMEAVLFRPDIGTLAGMRDRAILELLYSTGMRRSEATKLDIYDLNLTEKTVAIRSGKGGKGRVLPVGKTAMEFLIRYINETRPKLQKYLGFEVVGPQEPALFVVPGGGRLLGDSLGHIVSKYVRPVKPEVTLTCHAIRHAFATHMLRRGASIAVIQRMLGHSQINTTAIYTHVVPIDLKKEHKKCHPRGLASSEKGPALVLSSKESSNEIH
jgi:integrase/recombinase XerD